jgi:hypothetical protein
MQDALQSCSHQASLSCGSNYSLMFFALYASKAGLQTSASAGAIFLSAKIESPPATPLFYIVSLPRFILKSNVLDGAAKKGAPCSLARTLRLMSLSCSPRPIGCNPVGARYHRIRHFHRFISHPAHVVTDACNPKSPHSVHTVSLPPCNKTRLTSTYPELFPPLVPSISQ